jgi:hypothetical protein
VRRFWRRTTVAIAVSVCATLVAGNARAADKKKKAAAPAPAQQQEVAPPGEHPPEVRTSFNEFCEVWMGKLVERERFNKKQIKYRPGAAGVEGEYVGYSTEHTCDLRPPSSSGIAVGKVTYRELIYRKHGSSADAADASEPEIVEVTEITEIFRREKGKWIY